MSSIVADKRHEEVRIVIREEITSRRWPFWRMQCFDASSFANTDITPLLASLYTETKADSLKRLTWLIHRVVMDELIIKCIEPLNPLERYSSVLNR